MIKISVQLDQSTFYRTLNLKSASFIYYYRELRSSMWPKLVSSSMLRSWFPDRDRYYPCIDGERMILTPLVKVGIWRFGYIL